jgi:hypothetical protein
MRHGNGGETRRDSGSDSLPIADDPLTCDLPRPRMEHYVRRPADLIVQERKSRVIAASDE